MGSLKAMDRLGMAYENGELQLGLNTDKAQEWYLLYNDQLRHQMSRPWEPSDPALGRTVAKTAQQVPVSNTQGPTTAAVKLLLGNDPARWTPDSPSSSPQA
jgi:TPR repeat protein